MNPAKREPGRAKAAEVDLPFAESVGYQVRSAHRSLQRLLQLHIAPHGVTLGMWYFLRALWHEDGLSQRDLSRRVGTMEPTTMSAIQALEKKGFVRRASDATDARKRRVHLTSAGRRLKRTLIPAARTVVETATSGLTSAQRRALLSALASVTDQCDRAVGEFERRDDVAK